VNFHINKTMNSLYYTRAEPILLFPPNFLSSNSFFSYLFCSTFCYFFTHKRFLLVYLQLLSMHDCCIRVLHNIVIALLEYLDLLAVFPEACVDLILFVTNVVEYLHLSNSKKAIRHSSQTTIFPNFHLFFLEFCSCF